METNFQKNESIYPFLKFLPFNCQKPRFFTSVNSNFEMRLLAIDSSSSESLVYHFVENFILFQKIRGAFCMILPVEGAIAPASTLYQQTDIHVLGS